MATYQKVSDESFEQYAYELNVSMTISDINSMYAINIPKFSQINSVITKFKTRRGGLNISTSNTDVIIYFADSGTSSSSNTVRVGFWEDAATTEYKEFSADITKYCYSKTADAGKISSSAINNYTRLHWGNFGITARYFYSKEIGIYWDYTPPTYTITTKTSGSGTVSGGGTFNVTTTDQTKTLTATPSSGYKFVKWVDSNGKTYNTASINVTISQNSISAFATTVTYTAYFEKTKVTATFKNHDGTTLQTVEVNSGSTPSYTGSTPTKASTAEYSYTFSGWSPSLGNITANTTYTAQFTATKRKYTLNFKNADGSTVSTKSLEYGVALGTLPTVSRNGYTFVGWIPCAPARKADDTVLDSQYYAGDKASAQALHQRYKYTNNLSIHIEAYMSDWGDIKNLKAQILSCTESGGWGLGFMANSSGNGAEIQAGGYKGIDLGFNTPSNFTNKSWYTFDVVFTNGIFEAYLNGVKKGSVTTNDTSITYKYENAIFAGAEAGQSATDPAGNYFKGFISNIFIANQSTRLQLATTSTVVEKDVDYYPVWRKNTTCQATFKNHDGTTLQTVDVECGSTPSYTGSTPTKSSTAEYNYTFSGWSPALGTITTATTYTAQFTATKRKYTLTVTAGTGGSVSGGGSYEHGTSVTIKATASSGYKFKQWSDGNTNASRTVTVTGNATYSAVFEKLPPEFTSASMTYLNKQISASNKVICNEGFIISVGVT